MIWIKLLLLSVGAGFAYLFGGLGKDTAFKFPFFILPLWLFNTKVRDLGCPLIALITLWLVAGFQVSYWWAYLLSFGLMFGAYTTYWNKKGADEKPIHYALHGLGITFALLPFAIVTGLWLPFISRCIALAVFLYYWSILSSWAPLEEWMRGFAANLSLAFFLIPI